MTAGIVLAAGESTRMGRPKALLSIRGIAAVDVVSSVLRAAGCAPTVVVVGRHAREIRVGAVLRDVTVVDHRGWQAGRTSSLRAGLAALPGTTAAVVLALVDMPLVRVDTVRHLIATWWAAEPRPDVLAPVHDGRHGHPVLLSAALFPEIAALARDAPLRDLLRTRVRAGVAVDDPGVLLDLDEPDDLRHIPPP